MSVSDLLQKQRRYVVPLYQRAYVWSEQNQWEPLWEDIERQAEACLANENFMPTRSHFLGAIVLNVAKIVGASVARSEVIDGQQRLTTLQLFVAALRDFADKVGSEHTAKLTRLTINEDEPRDSDGRFKVWPTNADRVAFRAVMTAGSPSGVLTALEVADVAALPRIAAAYAYFHEQIANFADACAVADDDEVAVQAKRDTRIFGLYQSLRTALQLVVIELEDKDDPQVIFETLNARGQPLLPSDLIRNHVFLLAAIDPALNPDKLYDTYWRTFDETRIEAAIRGEDRFWHLEERQGRLARPRIDLFMFHYLVMKTERDLNVGALFREFRDWRDLNPTSIEDFLKDLKAHGSVFAALVAPTGSSRADTFASRLKALDTSAVYPLLLYILSLPVARLPLTDRDQIIIDIESWLIRRFVCQQTNKNYNKFFVQLLVKMNKAHNQDSLVDVVRRELTRSNDSTLVWPDDNAFSFAWRNNPVYVRSRPDRSAMLLRAIEAHIHTTKSEAIRAPNHLTVEHLLPQNGSLAHYPYGVPMPLAKDETDALCRKRIQDTIGNLTLLTRELNAAVSNGPFPKKVDQIVADSDLRLNAWLRKEPPSSWSEVSIGERSDRLFQYAVEIWPRPPG